MSADKSLRNGIPISVSLADNLADQNLVTRQRTDNRRVIRIAWYSFLIAIAVSFIARLLVWLISVVTNLFFYGHLSAANTSPAGNELGWLVIFIPVIGGIIVGFMALYGSKAIRGHGIPEAMEQILVNKSRIKPTVTYLKPLASAIAIGTGGPFGAEGPIIATGGALGSTIGQVLRITHSERKVLLAVGATAGMSAIFGSPIAAIFLAIELLLFEFSPRSIIPVAIACITGAAGHHFLFEKGPVFAMATVIQSPSNYALLGYSVIGLIIGVLSVLVTKSVYWIEDCFEKLPIHWMWWPAIGGLCVGVIGYFAPHTLGVGYDNIAQLLSGNAPLKLVISLCLLKFLSWALALGSGTSGGTLAPLLTIGGACGALGGYAMQSLFPELDVSISLAALIGMSAMFSGASRALLTSIVFAMETTSQANALLPLLAACTSSYIVSFLLMKNTIMTEKIVRRGVKTPTSFEPDMLKKIPVSEAIPDNKILLNEEMAIDELKTRMKKGAGQGDNHFVVVNNQEQYKGIINVIDVFNTAEAPEKPISRLIINRDSFIYPDNTLREAMERMSTDNTDILPVISRGPKSSVIGVVSYRDLIKRYTHDTMGHEKKRAHISLKRKSLKILVLGRSLVKSK
ncbi:MAG: chloride channel protein [Chitinophagaceae bacterium]